ncbi:MAG TPA: GGDEF domain-containing protein [Thermoleophilaceae bacterium]
MPRHHRIRLLAVAAVLVIAASVWIAGDRQRSAAEASSQEITSAQDMRALVLGRAADLAAYSSTGEQVLLGHYLKGGQQFEAALARSQQESEGHPAREHRLLRAQQTAGRHWARLADAVATDMVARGRRRIRPAEGARLEVALDAFEKANATFLAELGRQRAAGQRAVGRMTVGLIVLLSALFGGTAYLLFDRRARQDERRRDRHAGFTDVMQLARTEAEAYTIVKRYLERMVPGGQATVLNRNNSADRLEPASPVADPGLAEALEGAEPESCIAVRSGRSHRGGEGEELLSCEICGARPGNSTCMPSLVGGEVIGSVLVDHERPLDAPDVQYLATTIAEAAPIIANLRTLAVAELRAATDALTGLPNNRAVQETVRRMAAQAGRTTSQLAAILFDLDHFKQVNDVNGHAKGDEVLAAVGDAVASAVRASDFVGRYGGEEFLALLPDTGREGALHVAQKLRSAIAQIDVPGVSRKVTASFGVAVLPFDAVEPEQLLRAADRALYSAKGNGCDRVEVALAKPNGGDPVETALSSGEDG